VCCILAAYFYFLVLQISNRVCVALSRARCGLYVVGNINFLAERSKLWRDIRRSLVQERAVGVALPITCVLHGIEQVR
jgi:helicase required for RNAi-mediated heterochromatin assembly 1